MSINFNKKNIDKLNGKGKLLKSGIVATVVCLPLIFCGCNKSVFDTNYGFDKALIYGDDSAIVLDLKKWKDYSGEQIQLTTEDNFILLTSSFDTNCFYKTSSKYTADEVANNGVENKEVYYLNKDINGNPVYNKELLDTKWKFNKSIIFNGNRALILPVGKWKDYSGEQLQVITKDGLVLVLSSYNSKLAYDGESQITAKQFAESYVGSDGKIIDLSYGNIDGFNYDIIDFNYDFNKAIILKDETSVIVPITEWCDYEGEQIQLKIKNGPTMVTAAYDTILINDKKSSRTAKDIAEALSNEVIDLAGDYQEQSIFNKTILDFNNGFSNAIFSNDNSSACVKIDKWTDYEGEQLQIKLETGDVILSSSIMMDLINGGTASINASTLSKNYISSSGKNIDKSNGNIDHNTYNKYILDLEQKFKYALKVVDGNVTIIPLKKWLDFSNSDGGEEEQNSPNCEQLQLILPDETVLVTTAYDTALVNNVSDIYEIAEMFRGKDGVISDLTEYVGQPTANGWNFSIFDTKYRFNTAIINNGKTSQVFPIKKWLDYSEGEQVQIRFNDDTGVLTSFVNTTLVQPATPGIEEVIANAFSGNLNKEKPLVKIYD